MFNFYNLLWPTSGGLDIVLIKMPYNFNPQKLGKSLSVTMGEGHFSFRVGGAMHVQDPLLKPAVYKICTSKQQDHTYKL